MIHNFTECIYRVGNFNIVSNLLVISADMVYNTLVVLVFSLTTLHHKKKTMSSHFGVT